jgi:hypothetical protein
MVTRREFMALAAMVGVRLRAAEGPSGGNALMYVGAFPRRIMVIDEATERVVGEIPVTTGTPRETVLSDDKRRLYVVADNFEDVEVVDLAGRRVIDAFRLGEGGTRARILGMAVDPEQRYAVLAVEEATKQIDRWELKPTTIVQYDLKAHRTMRTIPWPDDEEQEFGNFKFSPDGKNLFIFGDDIVVYETSGFTQVDKWELSRPIEPGFGRIGFGALDDTYEEPGFATGIFTVRDAVQKRRIMGIARVNLLERQVDFYALGPAERVGFTMAPDRKLGYGLFHQPGRSEFWTFDLVNRRLRGRVPFQGRPRMGLKVSSNGRLLYIDVAGNTIDLYDAETFEYKRTITLDGDMTTKLYILPRR